jgi:Zn-dependent protease/CBS domain-containing protein
MTRNFRIFRIWGININIDWTWFLIAALITWNLGALFSQVHPNWGFSLTWGIALAAAVLFFLSVLLHELAHSVVAKSQGIPVRNIILFLFGGVSNIQEEPKSPGNEFFMAIVGPATSFVIGFLLLFIARLSAASLSFSLNSIPSALTNLSPIDTLLIWVGSTNIILGIFNMLPGFPLDGGRVLRSILWAIMDNLQQATLWASRAGQAIAWLMIVSGIAMVFGIQLPFFGAGFINGIWLAVIGWFLNTASVQSYQQLVIQQKLEGVPVTRLMRADLPSCSPDYSIDQLVSGYILGRDDTAFPVKVNGDLVGVVTLDDIRKVPQKEWATTRIGEVMTPSSRVPHINSNQDAAQALSKLVSQDIPELFVVENDKIAGMIRRQDIIRWLQLSDRSGPSLN